MHSRQSLAVCEGRDGVRKWGPRRCCRVRIALPLLCCLLENMRETLKPPLHVPNASSDQATKYQWLRLSARKDPLTQDGREGPSEEEFPFHRLEALHSGRDLKESGAEARSDAAREALLRGKRERGEEGGESEGTSLGCSGTRASAVGDRRRRSLVRASLRAWRTDVEVLNPRMSRMGNAARKDRETFAIKSSSGRLSTDSADSTITAPQGAAGIAAGRGEEWRQMVSRRREKDPVANWAHTCIQNHSSYEGQASRGG